MKGRGKFKEFLKKSQILSKLGSAYSKYGGMAGLPYAQQVGMASDVAKQAGYGRRKKRVGGSLRPAGARRGYGLRMAGGARHMISARRPMTW